jgi:hypothetical protein
MMEYWSDGKMVKESGTIKKCNRGIMGKQIRPLYPIFHSSNIPVFHEDPTWGLK